MINPKKYFVCEHHLKAEDILVSFGIGRGIFQKSVKLSIGNHPRKDVYHLQMNPLTTILMLLSFTKSETNPDRTKLLEKEVENLKESCIES